MTPADRQATPFHPVGAMLFQDVRLDVGCWHDDDADSPLAGHWLVEVTCWQNPVDPDSDDPPEACYTMAPTEARELIALITAAAEAAELFQE